MPAAIVIYCAQAPENPAARAKRFSINRSLRQEIIG